MRIIKVIGDKKSYLMDNGEMVPFEDIKEYVKKNKTFDIPEIKVSKNKGRKKRGDLQ